MQSEKISVLVVGATGRLGELITRHCIKRENLKVSILIRTPSKNQELVDLVKSAGGDVIEADITKHETLVGTTKGIHTVVCSLMGPGVDQGQAALLADAEQNGVKRFIPTEYSLSYHDLPEGYSLAADARKKFRKLVEDSKCKGMYVHNNIFPEWYFENQGAIYWGDGDQKVGFTTYEDTAKYLAAALSNPDRVGDLEIAVDKLSFKELAAVFEEAGRKVELKCLGTLDDCEKQIQEYFAAKNAYGAIVLQLMKGNYSGLGLVKESQTGEFPDVTPTHAKDWVKSIKIKDS